MTRNFYEKILFRANVYWRCRALTNSAVGTWLVCKALSSHTWWTSRCISVASFWEATSTLTIWPGHLVCELLRRCLTDCSCTPSCWGLPVRLNGVRLSDHLATRSTGAQVENFLHFILYTYSILGRNFLTVSWRILVFQCSVNIVQTRRYITLLFVGMADPEIVNSTTGRLEGTQGASRLSKRNLFLRWLQIMALMNGGNLPANIPTNYADAKKAAAGYQVYSFTFHNSGCTIKIKLNC